MFTAKILNSDATLNNFAEIGSLDFIPGEEKTFVFRLYDDVKNLRYIPPATNITTLTFNKTDGTSFTKTTTLVDSDDRSLQKVTLSETETTDLLGGNISFDLDLAGDASQIVKGIIYNGLNKVITGC